MSGFAELQQELTRWFGLAPRDNWRQELERAVDDVARAGRSTRLDLLERSQRDRVLLQKIAAKVTVQESHFFRHPRHLELLLERIRQRLALPSERVCVWSAGCSRGEEPYSLAIALLEALPAELRERVTIDAIDLNEESIDHARAGIYSEWALRSTTPPRRTRFFEKIDKNRFRLCQEAHDMVALHHGSIQERLRLILDGSLEAILFRNVAIYLVPNEVTDICQQFACKLRDGGTFLTAPSDACPLLPSFKRDNVEGSYIKVARSKPKWNEEARRPKPEVVPAPEVVPDKPIIQTASSPYARGTLLANEGDLKGAFRIAESMVATEPAAKQGWFLRGQLQLALGRAPDAAEDLRRALFVDPEDVLIRFWYAQALRETGARNRTRAQLNVLEENLRQRDGRDALEDGCTVKELRSAVEQMMERS